MKNSVNVLGTEYKIEVVKISECDELKENNWAGNCNKITKIILIGDASEEEFFGKMTKDEQEEVTKQILRHEITHAFFNESGLQESCLQYRGGWAVNEEMVDWIALQFPKMQKAFEEVGCL